MLKEIAQLMKRKTGNIPRDNTYDELQMSY